MVLCKEAWPNLSPLLSVLSLLLPLHTGGTSDGAACTSSGSIAKTSPHLPTPLGGQQGMKGP